MRNTCSILDDQHLQGGPLDKRAHHNALERRRRDHIKDSFHGLRDSIPSLHGEKVLAHVLHLPTCIIRVNVWSCYYLFLLEQISRAHILNKATDYIRVMQKSGLSREVGVAVCLSCKFFCEWQVI